MLRNAAEQAHRILVDAYRQSQNGVGLSPVEKEWYEKALSYVNSAKTTISRDYRNANGTPGR